VGLLLFLWLSTTAMAISPVLHHLIHANADGPDHQCAVTALHQGKVHSSTPAVVRPVPVVSGFVLPLPEVSVSLPAVLNRLALGRAPPAVVFSLS
jgi:hypothetical protein